MGTRRQLQPMANDDGMTLLEMLVVLAIIAGIYAMAAPNLREPTRSIVTARGLASSSRGIAQDRASVPPRVPGGPCGHPCGFRLDRP